MTPEDSEVDRALTAPETSRSLLSLPLLACTTGYERLGRQGGFSQAVSADGRARAIFDVDEDICRLECAVAFKDERPARNSKADFVVVADDREVAVANGVTAGQPPRPLTAELERAHILELRVQTNQFDRCRAAWADPILLPDPAFPSRPMVDCNGRTLPGESRLPESRMTELEALALGLNTDKGTVHSYLPYYSSVFSAYRRRLANGENIALLEIGVRGGGSIHLWRDYFGSQLNLHCIDLNKPGGLPRGSTLHLGSACDEIFLKSRLSDTSFDIIIDDGSHEVEEQIQTFLLLRPFLKLGGLYIIEDIQAMSLISRIESETSTNFELVDLRANKKRYDDVLLVYMKARQDSRKPRQHRQKTATISAPGS